MFIDWQSDYDPLNPLKLKEWEQFSTQWDTKIKPQRCLIQEAMKLEEKKPPHMRQKSFLISCPCPKCNPFFM